MKEENEQSDTYSTVRDPEDGSMIFVHKDLEQRLAKEVNAEKKRIQKLSKRKASTTHQHCSLCPFFASADNHWRARLLRHIERHHAQKKFRSEGGAFLGTGLHVASGTKQLKIIKALYDDDSLYGSMAINYLQRSADITRRGFVRQPTKLIIHMGQHIVLV